MQHVLVTGAGGFLGGHVVRRFLAAGYGVYATVHRAVPTYLEKLQAQGTVSLLRVDMTDFQSMRDVMDKLPRLDAVIHCAARVSDVGRDEQFRRSNLEAVTFLAENALRREAGIFVFVSTTDVYGIRDFAGETESALHYDHDEKNPYPRYKILAEQWLRENMPSDRYSIVRPGVVWGEGDPTVTRRIRDFLAFSPWIVHFGPWRGKNRWPLVHVARAADACFIAATHPSARGAAFHVLDPEHVTVEDLCRRVASEHFPDKRYRSVCLPLWCGMILGAVSTGIANMLNLEHPPWDPSLYALYSVSSNLDFSTELYESLL